MKRRLMLCLSCPLGSSNTTCQHEVTHEEIKEEDTTESYNMETCAFHNCVEVIVTK